jgi:Glyoxalase/Bleomycin resistance protein/Dioxygenase superfamily
MGAEAETKCAPTAFGGVNPVFCVANVDASVQYYVQKLGFRKDWGSVGFACVSRDRCSIFLSEGDQGHPGAWVWIGVGDVEMVCDELRRKGAKIRHEPTNYPWALEMQVEDIDGNVLRIGSDAKPDQPTGEWLDRNRVRWIPNPAGGWNKIAD